MDTPTEKRGSMRLPLIITLALLAVVAIVFLVEFVAASQPAPASDPRLNADTYMDIVAPLIAEADAARGETLVNSTYECHTCHVQGAAKIAPSFEGLGARAAQTRPPLTAAAYLYEAIVRPDLHIVEGYANAMPLNYRQRINETDMGDIIAYLLNQ